MEGEQGEVSVAGGGGVYEVVRLVDDEGRVGRAQVSGAEGLEAREGCVGDEVRLQMKGAHVGPPEGDQGRWAADEDGVP